jgi:hypothetical protein
LWKYSRHGLRALGKLDFLFCAALPDPEGPYLRATTADGKNKTPECCEATLRHVKHTVEREKQKMPNLPFGMVMESIPAPRDRRSRIVCYDRIF